MSRFHQAKRRSKQKNNRRGASLNLVSLMDIFTILVFFLMVNSSEVEVLQSNSDIKLPDSSSEQKPKDRLTISVTANEMMLAGRKVADVSTLDTAEVNIIEGLQAELEYQAKRKGEIPEGGFEITIMGDKQLPYWLLKKIMLTCQSADFARISLAVNQLQAPKAATVSSAGVSTASVGASS